MERVDAIGYDGLLPSSHITRDECSHILLMNREAVNRVDRLPFTAQGDARRERFQRTNATFDIRRA